MKLISLLILPALVLSFGACKSAKKNPAFCDTACMTDSLKFVNESHNLSPYVYISVSNCRPDTVTWSFRGMGIDRKLGFEDLAGTSMPLDRNFVKCVFNGSEAAWLLFNDCSNGRGYFVKIPFDKAQSIQRKGSVFSSLDPKFNVAEGLVAYTDRGNVFVEEMMTGKKAMMTFGVMIDEMDYDALHETVDSVHISPNRIWVKVKIAEEWKVLEKSITLE